MAQVRMLVGVAGRTFSYRPGQVVDLAEAQAQAWISAGIAAPVRDERETATPPEYETTAMAEPRHVGGGWYELPDGRRVQGRDDALEQMREDA